MLRERIKAQKVLLCQSSSANTLLYFYFLLNYGFNPIKKSNYLIFCILTNLFLISPFSLNQKRITGKCVKNHHYLFIIQQHKLEPIVNAHINEYKTSIYSKRCQTRPYFSMPFRFLFALKIHVFKKKLVCVCVCVCVHASLRCL